MAENKCNRNILDKETGFNVRTNLYIIRYLYYHMKKAGMFMESGSYKRMKTVDLQDFIQISKPRLYRIFNGDRFELTARESANMIEIFNIRAEYFKKNGELIEISGITENDWYCFFGQTYGEKSVKKLGVLPDEMAEKAEKVQKALNELPKKDYIKNHYDTSHPLFRIHYYFEQGTTFKEFNRLQEFLESLKALKISDWKELADKPEDMKKYLQLLKKHYEYVDAYIKYREFEKID